LLLLVRDGNGDFDFIGAFALVVDVKQGIFDKGDFVVVVMMVVSMAVAVIMVPMVVTGMVMIMIVIMVVSRVFMVMIMVMIVVFVLMFVFQMSRFVRLDRLNGDGGGFLGGFPLGGLLRFVFAHGV
jgi:uncharacterized membrane protein YgcG